VGLLDLPHDGLAFTVGEVQVHDGTFRGRIECGQAVRDGPDGLDFPADLAEEAPEGHPHPVMVFDDDDAVLIHRAGPGSTLPCPVKPNHMPNL